MKTPQTIPLFELILEVAKQASSSRVCRTRLKVDTKLCKLEVGGEHVRVF